MIIRDIQKKPTGFSADGQKTHESVLRSYHIVQKVKEMLERKDSPETILEVIFECEHYILIDDTYKRITSLPEDYKKMLGELTEIKHEK